MPTNTRLSERGQAMMAAVLITFMLGAIATTYLVSSAFNKQSQDREVALERARLAAREGVSLSLAELKSGADVDGDGLGTLAFNGADGRVIQVAATDLGGNLYQLHSEGRLPLAAQAVDTFIEVIPAQPLAFDARAAIAAAGPVTTTGNINVDGRDWDALGAGVVGPGVFGISTTQTVTQSGSSTAGGNGVPPANPADPGTLEPFADWADGIDNDGDGSFDEELFDGLDNDGDGEVDEDTHGYPTSPDVMFGLPDGTLAQMAVAAGTYFTSEAAVDAYIAAHGGDLPGGQIIYAAFDLWQPADFGGSLNSDPSIIVHHNSSGTALMKNIHGEFAGLVLADLVEHINGDFTLVGALMSFADDSIGNAFGNGSAEVLYSSEVLANLPAGSTTSQARILSYSRSAVQ